jgi:phosphatidylserine/phosphatidylglycerophosphate/cardiolipin synthase-like enzyme
VIDKRYIFLGSHNLTQGALKYNNELSVLIDSPEMAAEVRAYLERE